MQKRRAGLRVLHSYFAIPDDPSGADVLRCHQLAAIPDSPGWLGRPFRTLVCDLTLGEEALFERLEKETRYEVRRARDKDGLQTAPLPSPDEAQIRRFEDFYRAFASRKGLSPVDPELARQAAAQGALALTWIRAPGGAEMAAHLYLVAEGRARLCYSAGAPAGDRPADRALLGRANRLLHWEDLRSFRARGLTRLDLGGIQDPEGASGDLGGIDRFKQAFGGEVVEEYECERSLSRRGALALALSRWGRSWPARAMRGNP